MVWYYMALYGIWYGIWRLDLLDSAASSPPSGPSLPCLLLNHITVIAVPVHMSPTTNPLYTHASIQIEATTWYWYWMTSETIAIQQTILIVTYICFLRNSQPSEGSNFGSLVGTFGQKSEMECHCDSHHWEATERGPKGDLFWRGFAKCSSFTLLPVHTGSFVFPQTPSP